MFTGISLLSPPPPLIPPPPCFPSVQFNSLPTDRCALLSEHLELATVLTEGLFYEALPGGSHGACLNFKKSHVSVYKCFTLLSEIEQKFFVFVRILKKGHSDVLWRNHYSPAISQLTFRILNTYGSPFTINTIHRRVHWSSLTRDVLWSARKITSSWHSDWW